MVATEEGGRGTFLADARDAGWLADAAGYARLLPHDGIVLKQMRIVTVKIDPVQGQGATELDSLVKASVSAPSWKELTQYGVGRAALVASLRTSREQMFVAGDVVEGFVSEAVFEQRVRSFVDAHAGSMPSADGYVFFLPDGVNLTFGMRGTYTYKTCVDVSGYHSHDGREAFAVLPPCDKGRSGVAISHELAEMATNPVAWRGWYSEQDLNLSAGEVADLCVKEGPSLVGGVALSRFWSNERGRCLPE